MYSYGLLETGCYYLVQEKENDPIHLIKATLESDHCMFVMKYEDSPVTQWKRKSDPIHDIIECLTDDAVRTWEKYYNSEDAYYEEDDE